MAMDLFDRINKKSYNGDLVIVNEIKSVNCKEWEDERKYLEKVEGISHPMATRYYVKIRNIDGKELKGHYHKGHIDFRSNSPTISDAFIPIPEKEGARFHITCKKSYKSDDPFNPTILTVPYATPTKEFSSCSPASLWIVLTTLSYEFGKEYLSLVEINNCLSSKLVYLFSWDDIIGRDIDRLAAFFKLSFGIDWITTAEVDRVDDYLIKFSFNEDVISLVFNDSKTKVYIIHKEQALFELTPKTEKGKLNIYRPASNAVELKNYDNLFKKFNYSAKYYLGKKKEEYYKKCENQIYECEKTAHDYSMSSFYWIYRDNQDDLNEPIMDWEILYAYIESEIPVYLVFKWNDLREKFNCGKPNDNYHSIVAIGHTLDEKSNVSNFIIHDVSCGPFLEIPKEMIDNELYEALVILPVEVTIRYENVQIILSKIIKMYDTIFGNILEKGSKPLSRPFLMRSQRIKFWYTNNVYPEEVRNMYSIADFPPYVWVFEIRTPKLKEKDSCIGQIIIDATKPEDGMGLVLMNFPKYRLWYENKKMMEKQVEIASFEELPLFRADIVIK